MITSIIPLFNLTEDRKKNLEFIYERLLEAKIEVVFAIQSDVVDNYYKKFKEAKILNFFNIKYKNFNKSFLFNSCLKNIKSFKKFVLFLDCDVFFSFKDLGSKIMDDDEIVQPFSECHYLDEQHTYNFIYKREAEVSPKFKKVSYLGACSFLIKSDVADKIKFNEEFYNWGYEDVKFGKNLRRLKIRTILQTAIHLYHKNIFNNIKVSHVFKSPDCAEVLNSYITCSNQKNVTLIACGSKTNLNNDKIRFEEVAEYQSGHYLGEILEKAADVCEEKDWILYTDSDFLINEEVYSILSKCQHDYVEFTGCEINKMGHFIRPTDSVNGFAVRKKIMKSFYYPKVFTNFIDWGKIVSEYFKNLKKIKIENQLTKIIKLNKKIETFNGYKTILYFSPHAPDPYTSGGDRLINILKILKMDLGYNVHFFCNVSKELSHAEALREIGIQCYTPNNGSLDFYLQEIKDKVNCAFFSWYDMSLSYSFLVRKLFPEAKIVVDTVDVHWKREERGFEKKEIDLSEEQILLRKEQEKLTYIEADVLLAVTLDDKKEIIKEIGNESNIKILSNIHEEKTNFKKQGNDIIFIGNFNHTPNISAAILSIKIYNKFINSKTYKNLSCKPKLYVVGNKLPTNIEKMCNGETCIALRDVKNLDDVYNKIKISISPLTWGAGIKGKICDAIIREKIVLTSEVGNEGINLIDGVSGFIAGDEDQFVEKLEEIYKINCLDSIIKNAKEKIKNLVSRESAECILKHTVCAKPVLIVIVTYNKSLDLQRCLNSIIQNTLYPNYKIIVYDNDSVDDTELVVNKIKEANTSIAIDYIKSEKNNYFVFPNNEIMKEEKYKEFDVVLVNNDIEIVSKCWLTYLYSAAYSEYNICSVGGKILYPDGVLAEAGAELYNDGSGCNIGLLGDAADPRYNYQRYAGYCSGCLLYIRRDAINKVGYFDEDFAPMYYEESEWQYRAHLKGLKTIYEPKVEAIHHESKNKEMKVHQKINKEKFLKKYYDKNIEQYNHKIV